ncbi:MAG: YdeI/OmpD-associated family protein [Chitinophagaceae bacterium]
MFAHTTVNFLGIAMPVSEIHLGIKAVSAPTRKAWRSWLAKNHEKENSVWLILFSKTSSVPSIYYDEAVEEALCFGWVDSKGNKRDEESSYLYFAKRKPKSNWSKANKDRVEKLTKLGLIMPAGQAMIDLAKKTGTWSTLEVVDKLTIPPDMQTLFSKNKTAEKNFLAFPASTRRGILEWILNAKRPETRQKRIEETVTLAAQNIRANQYVKK